MSHHFLSPFLLFFFLLIYHLTITISKKKKKKKKISPYNYTFSNISLLLLHFFLPTTLYLNVIISQSFRFPFILTLLLPILFAIKFFYYFFHLIHILSIQKSEFSLSLSIIYSFLQLYFRILMRSLLQIDTFWWCVF